MKKFLLFVSTVFFSLFLVNKVHAQEFPEVLMKVPYNDHYLEQIHQYTYEYHVSYVLENIVVENLNESDYYFVSNRVFEKGFDSTKNSYELYNVIPFEPLNYTTIYLRITIDIQLEDVDYNGDITPLFSDDSALYITYTINTDSPDYNAGYSDGYNDGYDEGRYDGYYDGYVSGHYDGYNEGRNDGYNEGYNVGYNDGYNEGYDDGYNDFNVADYFGDRNIAKAPDIDYGTASDSFEPSTAIILINKGYGAPNILLDKQYLIVIIKKNIYDDVVVLFDDYTPIYHYNATYHDIDDFDIYVFNFSNRINSKYELEIRKENVTTSEQLNNFLNDVKSNLYFSHASKLLDSTIASQFYNFGYIAGLEEMLSNHEAYNIGYDTGYNRGYIDGKEDGYELGYIDGFDYGKTVEYEHGYQTGYNDGYNDGIKEPFYSNFHVWIVPAIIIVVIAGIFVGYRRERYGGD